MLAMLNNLLLNLWGYRSLKRIKTKLQFVYLNRGDRGTTDGQFASLNDRPLSETEEIKTR